MIIVDDEVGDCSVHKVDELTQLLPPISPPTTFECKLSRFDPTFDVDVKCGVLGRGLSDVGDCFLELQLVGRPKSEKEIRLSRKEAEAGKPSAIVSFSIQRAL